MEAPEALARFEASLKSHLACADRCASQEYLTVRLGATPTRSAVVAAAARLAECGLVHLWKEAAEEAIRPWRHSVDVLRAATLDTRSELTKSDLRANRTELFLPFDDGLPDPLAEGVVTAVLAEYVGEPFSLDYVSLLNARAGVAGAQDLHSDVPFFPRTSLSVHTAVEAISEAMGPTLFCPCTHSVTGWEEAPPGTAIVEDVGFATALRSAIRATGSVAPRPRCLGTTYVPSKLPAGLITIYDGAVLHAGLANTASMDRVVFNINFCSPPGYEELRNYTAADTRRVVEETARWRRRSNAAGRPAVERLEALRAWPDGARGISDGT